MFVYFFSFKVSGTFSNFCEIICSTEWFQQLQEFTNEIENMVDELKKCLAKFCVSVGKTDDSYYKKTTMLSIRAALDRHLKAPKSFKKLSLFYFIFSNNDQMNVIILKQWSHRLRLDDYSPIFASPLVTNC